MKKILIGSACFVVIAASVAFTTINKLDKSSALKVDTKSSRVDFNGSKKGGYHPGYFLLKSGTVNVAEGKITGGSFTVDVNSLHITDEAGDKLAGHLKSGGFLDAGKFGDAIFNITNVSYSDANNAQITGDLTLKGVKVEIKFDAKVRAASDDAVFAEAFFSIDRTKFGVGEAGMIASDVQMGVHLFATK